MKNLKFLRSFISNNVNPPEMGAKSRFWPREMKIAKDLFNKFPNEDFWNKMVIGFKLNSLAWFMTKDGNAMLTRKFAEFNFVPQNKEENILHLSDEKFGEDRYNHKPMKFISDFLK